MPTTQVNFSVRRLSDTLTPQIRSIMTALGGSGKSKVLGEVGREFVRMSKSTFGGNNANYRGNKWPRYSKSYTAQVGNSTPTLYRSGKMKASIRVSGQGANWVGISCGTKYAAAQFLGSPKSHIPARRFMPLEGAGNSWRLTARAERELVSVITRGFSNISKGALTPNIGVNQRSSFAVGNPCSGRS